ncbi:type II CAAX prenyl endopeptidase Rce1 family protein [Halogeometricum sp. CBA1124]|uniref:CPBP family glutamic-type intramembrane protease n=1 Tax=Halogeometricum sp. CBA1124 TaxID=2668071 RepID=UPI001429E8CF|nr:CPBP family glutamic-type intramembrane protease [Halogeometricum sp. CBA1124]MUV57723.1 CPBP family intramembrane metalloprotease [Halogeometricum sp. CBA1124]
MVFVPVAFGFAIPDVSLVEGTTLPAWAALFVVVVGVALGAAVSEELLYRGVLLRALEPRGRVLAVVLPAVVFGLSHVSQVVLGNSLAEWLPQMILIIRWESASGPSPSDWRASGHSSSGTSRSTLRVCWSRIPRP